MKLDITQKTAEPLLARTSVKGTLTFDKEVPKADDVKAAIGKSLGKEADMVVVKGIYTHYGLKIADVSGVVYDDQTMMKRIEEFRKKKKAEKKPAK